LASKSQVTDISNLEQPDGSLPKGLAGRLALFLGRIVSAASMLQPGQSQISPLRCRRRPNRRPCPGVIEIIRPLKNLEITWRCDQCGDQGDITNWRETRWDLSSEIKKGRIIPLNAMRARRHPRGKPHNAYELVVELIGGPIPLEELVVRRIRVAGNSTLHDLHKLLQGAFERDEEAPYEFMFGAPYDIDAQRLTGAVDTEFSTATEPRVPYETEETTIDAMQLESGRTFGYLFDFGEEWIHRITVAKLTEIVQGITQPKVMEEIGSSPPQHPADSDEWMSELLWEELEEDDCPVSGIFGPYNAENPLDAGDWLALDELERLMLVFEAHSENYTEPQDANGSPRHPPIVDQSLHALLHATVETQIAAGIGHTDKRLGALQRTGLSRHQAIHELGRSLVQQLLNTTEKAD
jgi:hypothetical protein